MKKEIVPTVAQGVKCRKFDGRDMVALILVLVVMLSACEQVSGPESGEVTTEASGKFPDGFSLVSSAVEDNGLFNYVYRNSTDGIVTFGSVPAQNSTINLDTENAAVTECFVGGYAGMLIKEGPEFMFVWIEPDPEFVYIVKAINIDQMEFFEITEILLDGLEK